MDVADHARGTGRAVRLIDERLHRDPAVIAGFAQPPKGVLLDSPEQIAANAPKLAETVANRYMPIGNLTQMTDDERSLIAAWFAQGAATK